MDTLVTSGSSFFSVIVRWFTAAFVAPYAPHDAYALEAAPEDVNTILPFVARSNGSPDWIWLWLDACVAVNSKKHGNRTPQKSAEGTSNENLPAQQDS